MKRARGWLLFFALAGVLPLVAYAALVAWLHGRDAATVMLGAASGAGVASLVAMIAALLLRVYLVVVLPGLSVYVVARAITSRAGA